jgi:hypothetical protein|eukprot:COSAG01_NODE_6020_length_3898_cov_1319.174520_1_plen_394_part_00
MMWMTCDSTPPCTYSWVAENFQPCPTECGQPASTLNRDVTCKSEGGNLAPNEGSCVEQKPAATHECPATTPCPAQITYAWEAPLFAPCLSDCGQPASQLSRLVRCMATDAAGSTVVSESEAVCTTPKPPTEQACAATAPCPAAHWKPDRDFSPCSTACGTAASTQERQVQCIGANGQPTDPTACTDSKPETSRVCPATPPCAPPAASLAFSWSVKTHFPPCPPQCGLPASTQTRTVVCQGSDNVQVPVGTEHSTCTGVKPPTTRQCAATAPCQKFRWQVPDFPPCPTDCGKPAAVQTRPTMCVSGDGKPTRNTTPCMLDTTLTKPPSARNCPATAPCRTQRLPDLPNQPANRHRQMNNAQQARQLQQQKNAMRAQQQQRQRNAARNHGNIGKG